MASGVTTPPRLLPLIREAVLSAGGWASGRATPSSSSVPAGESSGPRRWPLDPSLILMNACGGGFSLGWATCAFPSILAAGRDPVAVRS